MIAYNHLYSLQVIMEATVKEHYEYLDEFQIVKILGSGYSAQVKLALDLEGKQIAIKQYKHETSTIQTLKEQLKIMQVLHHPNLVKLIDVRQKSINKKPKQPAQTCFAIILQYVGGGQLFDFIAETGKFSEKVSRTFFHQLMNGLHYMHDKGYAHRDIKPENLILTNDFRLKIADFGFSCLIKGKDGTGILKTRLGTQGYMAPEILEKHYDGRKTDIFACGIILFIMYAGNPPFERAFVTDPYYKLIKQKKFEIFWNAHSRKRTAGFFTQSFRHLFEKMIAYDPKQRPISSQIIKHLWFKEAVSSEAEIKQEFILRKQKMQAQLQLKRKEKEIQFARRKSNIQGQGYNNRDNEQNLDIEFMQIYNKQKLLERHLPKFQAQHSDIVTKQQISFVVSTIKRFIQSKKIIFQQQQSEMIETSEEDRFILKGIEDKNHKMQITYSRSYQIQQQSFQEVIAFQIHFGYVQISKIGLRIGLISGSSFYYKFIINSLKQNCFV